MFQRGSWPLKAALMTKYLVYSNDNFSLFFAETRERQRTVRFADEVEQSGGEGHSSKGAGTTSIQDFLLKMAGQPLPDKQVHREEGRKIITKQMYTQNFALINSGNAQKLYSNL